MLCTRVDPVAKRASSDSDVGLKKVEEGKVA